MKKEKIEKLFNQYEKAFDKLDLETIAGLYAETILSAGPKGTIADKEPKIILFITHQDEEEYMKKLGLLKRQTVG